MCVSMCIMCMLITLNTFTTATDSHVNVLLTCDLGFSSRPAPLNDSIGTFHQTNQISLLHHYQQYFPLSDSLENHGVLLLWDSAMPRIKREFDEMRRIQAAYR